MMASRYRTSSPGAVGPDCVSSAVWRRLDVMAVLRVATHADVADVALHTRVRRDTEAHPARRQLAVAAYGGHDESWCALHSTTSLPPAGNTVLEVARTCNRTMDSGSAMVEWNPNQSQVRFIVTFP